MKHTLKLFYRNFRKNLTVNLINVGGLTLSMAVVLVLATYCYSELTTDWHHDHADQTYLIEGNTPAILADHMVKEIPELRHVVRIGGTFETPVINLQDGSSYKTELTFVDNGFFKLFQYKSLRGDLKDAFNNPMSLILTEKEAMRLFGTINVVGRIVKINNKHEVVISAIIAPSPGHSFLSLKGVVPMSGRPNMIMGPEEMTSWRFANFKTFFQINTDTDLAGTGHKIESIFNNNRKKKKASGWVSFVQLKEIYFSGIDNSFSSYIIKGDFSKTITFMMVALLILIIALINYVNISSYGINERSKQTGLFKILGAGKIQVFTNIIFESVMVFFISYWVAILMIEIFRPLIHQSIGMESINKLILQPSFIITSLSITIFFGIVTNIIPSIRHVAVNPAVGMKKTARLKSGEKLFQGTMVVFQFSAAIVLITFTLLVQAQIQYGNTDLGHNDENVIGIRLTKQMKKEVLKNRLNSKSYIKNVSLTQYFPGQTISKWSGAKLSEEVEGKDVWFNIFTAGTGFVEIMDLEVIAGRNYSDSIMSDQNAILINETFVREYSIENPLDLSFKDDFMGISLNVIGVIKDFHYMPKNHEIGPLIIRNADHAFYCLAEISSNNFTELRTAVEDIESIAADLSPDFPVEISFLDDAIENMYQSEIQFQRIFIFFAGCAIFISCLGILALSLFTSQQRTKEIGVRKVNGAHVEDILLLLNKNFIKWVAIAFVIASPIAWFSMSKWLEGFAYKTEISWWMFLIGGGMALIIALLTVSWQSWMAARRNPVDALRYE